MDIFLDYPMPSYFKNVKRAVDAGNNVHVSISNMKLKGIIETTLAELASEGESKSSAFNCFWRWFRLSSFLTGHFYALSAGYSFSYRNSEILLVSYANQNA